MAKLWAYLQGKKSYIVAAAGILWTGAQLWTGAIDQNTAVDAILGFLGIGTLRHGISTSAKP